MNSHSHPHKSLRKASALAAAVKAGENLCATRKARLTPMRRLVLKELLKAQRPLPAYELLDHLQALLNKRMAPLTIYRALDFLIAQGLVHRLESLNSFVACDHPGLLHNSLYLVCTGCGTADEMDSAEVQALLLRAAGTRHFKPSRPVVEVQGLCKECMG